MNPLPAREDNTVDSLNSLKYCTSGANSEPYAAEAMMHGLEGVTIAVTTVVLVVRDVVTDTRDPVSVVVVVVVDIPIEDRAAVVAVVIVGEYTVEVEVMLVLVVVVL